MTAFSSLLKHVMPPSSSHDNTRAPSPLSFFSQEARTAATARMQSELARAVAASISDGRSPLTPSFSLASALSGGRAASQNMGAAANCNLNARCTTPGMRSPFGSCESLCALGESLAAPRPTPTDSKPANQPPRVHSAGDNKLSPRQSGAATPLLTNLGDAKATALLSTIGGGARPAAAGNKLSVAADGYAHSPSEQPPRSPTLSLAQSSGGLTEMFCALDERGGPPLLPATSFAGMKRRSPSAAAGAPGSATPVPCAPSSASASPALAPHQPSPRMPPTIDLSLAATMGGSCPSATVSPSALSPSARESLSPGAMPQSVTVLPGTQCAMPRIANLSRGCSDGLMLLSTTAFLVARDNSSPSAAAGGGVLAAAKRQRV